MTFVVEDLRAEFPALNQSINGHPLHYFDNAATTLKPRSVIDAITRYNDHDTANVHRGLHTLSARATEGYESTRAKLAAWFSVPEQEVVYTRGTTESINIVSQCWARYALKADDEIVITTLEHHANIVPWQIVCEQTGAKLRVIPLTGDGHVDLDAAEKIIGPKTRLLAISAGSNAIGSMVPLEALIGMAKANGSRVLLDGAQLSVRNPIDLPALGCDFYACSAHKMFGPTGTGMLWGRAALLEEMTPWMAGGDMIETVTFEKTTYADIPWKFEAGTPNIGGFIGWSAAMDFLHGLDHAAIAAHEQALLERAQHGLSAIEGLNIIGPRTNKLPIISFRLDGCHEQDIATLLDENGIAVRTGHHCAMPLMQSLGIRGTVRASISAYNTAAEIDHLTTSLKTIARLLR